MNMSTQLILFAHLMFLLVPMVLGTGDSDCCKVPKRCKNPDCSCCTEERYKICEIQGRTACGDNCMPGYHGGFCYNKCPDHCLTCKDWDKGNSRICLTCEEGYHVAYRRCVPDSCPETCLSCRNETHCSKCVTGHHNGQDPMTSVYYSDCRLTCPVHCTACDSQNNCSRCEYGYFGIQCSSLCSYGCYSGVCFQNGSCTCKEGFSGFTCDTCSNCTIVCSNKCLNNDCDDMTGRCINGCLGNFQEPYCMLCTPNFKGKTCESCASGKYGTNCTKTCPNRCVTCNQQTGLCEVCEGNFMGNTCEDCKIGFHGQFCTDVCSSNCVNNICNRSNGTCAYGCISEYSGDMCCLNKSNCKTCLSNSKCLQCIDGYYGKQCQLECPLKCISCNKSTGKCYGCYGNYGGEKCQECNSGYYGEICNFTCSKGCKTGRCTRENGVCDNGCLKGYSGDKCCLNNTFCDVCFSHRHCSKCVNGSYGDNCMKKCSENCKDASCNRQNGNCYGCINDFFGPICNSSCSPYCKKVLNTNRCHEMTGRCAQGCVFGYFGASCDQKCNANCINGSCNQDSGSCLHGCINGFSGKRCAIRENLEDPFPMDQSLFAGLIVSIVLVATAFIVALIILIKRGRDDKDKPIYENQSKGKNILNIFNIVKNGNTNNTKDHLRNKKTKISEKLAKLKRDLEVIELQLAENVPMDNKGDGDVQTYEQLESGNENNYAGIDVN